MLNSMHLRKEIKEGLNFEIGRACWLSTKDDLINKIKNLSKNEFERYFIDISIDLNNFRYCSAIRIFNNGTSFTITNILQSGELIENDFEQSSEEWVEILGGDIKDIESVITDEFYNNLENLFIDNLIPFIKKMSNK